jgi:hypothetical protein
MRLCDHLVDGWSGDDKLRGKGGGRRPGLLDG